MDRLKPPGRTLEEFKPIGTGERLLLAACRNGEMAPLGTEVPESATDAQRVRAAFLRFLLLGGDEQAPVHERGVLLRGAFVEGRLDLMGCRIAANVTLVRCRFDTETLAQDAQVEGVLAFDGSHLAEGLNADRLRCSAGLFLRDGFKATGNVRLVGAQVGGNLSCRGGQFEVKEGDALSADCAVVKGDVFLDDGFKATGKVRLLGAQVSGDLACRGGQFEVKEGDALAADRAVVKGDVFLNDGFKATGNVSLLGAQVGGNLACTGGQFEVKEGDALSADRAVVKGDVFLNDGFKATGQVKLPGAQVGGNLDCRGGQFEVMEGDALHLEGVVVRGAWQVQGLSKAVRINAAHSDVAVLADELAAWAPGTVLDGFRYAAIGGLAPTHGTDRLKWLGRQRAGHLDDKDFRPQPWRQLQRVLRDMGHTEDAKQVGIAYEDRLRAIGRIGQAPPGTSGPIRWLKRAVARGTHYGFGKLAGYGYRPIRLVGWMVSVWLLCGAAYWWLALPPRSALAPSDPLVFQNRSYEECLPDRAENPGNWFLCGPLRGEYATLSPLALSLDVMLPLVDLGQEKSWGAFVPTPEANPLQELFGHFHWGHAVRLLIWLETLFGWLSSLLLVAIVSGFSRRNEEG